MTDSWTPNILFCSLFWSI